MNILVCISRVPDTASKIQISSNNTQIEKQGLKFIINPYDEFALEEGLRIKEKFGGTVTTVTIGTDEAKDILRSALAMGSDKVTLIKAPEFFDSFFVAKNLAEYANEIKPDIILLGKQSVDYDSLQVPSILAQLLNLPVITVVSKLVIEGNTVTAEKDIEGGKEVVETTLPCIISAQKGLNEPRYPKLPDIMKAKSKPIEERNALEIPSKVSILNLSIPIKQRAGKILSDSDEDIKEIVRLLHEEAKVI